MCRAEPLACQARQRLCPSCRLGFRGTTCDGSRRWCEDLRQIPLFISAARISWLDARGSRPPRRLAATQAGTGTLVTYGPTNAPGGSEYSRRTVVGRFLLTRMPFSLKIRGLSPSSSMALRYARVASSMFSNASSNESPQLAVPSSLQRETNCRPSLATSKVRVMKPTKCLYPLLLASPARRFLIPSYQCRLRHAKSLRAAPLRVK